jgi:hypothetical protein
VCLLNDPGTSDAAFDLERNGNCNCGSSVGGDRIQMPESFVSSTSMKINMPYILLYILHIPNVRDVKLAALLCIQKVVG